MKLSDVALIERAWSDSRREDSPLPQILHEGEICLSVPEFVRRTGSRDNVVFGVLGLGEGWHHTPHTFPTSARHGQRWWQIDVSYWVIRGLALVGLAWNVQLPLLEAQAAKRDRQDE